MGIEPVNQHPAVHLVPEGRTGHSLAFERQFAGETPASQEEEDDVRQTIANIVLTAAHPTKLKSTYQVPVRSEKLRQLAESLLPDELRNRVTVFVYV